MKFFNKILKKCKEIYEFHVKEKGNSWKICGIEFLRQKLREKIEAWNTELAFDGAGELSELIDIINYALMLTTRLMS